MFRKIEIEIQYFNVSNLQLIIKKKIKDIRREQSHSLIIGECIYLYKMREQPKLSYFLSNRILKEMKWVTIYRLVWIHMNAFESFFIEKNYIFSKKKNSQKLSKKTFNIIFKHTHKSKTPNASEHKWRKYFPTYW